MRHLEAVSEAKMVAKFLQGEIVSERFRYGILALLRRDGRDRKLIDQPNITNAADNLYRKQLLGDFRGYAQNRDHFEHFPNDVTWNRFALNKDELWTVKYIDYSYWNELSGGSRMPRDAARNLRDGKTVFGKTNERYWQMAEALSRGANFPELILVGLKEGSPLVVLEGHMRITVYALTPEYIPDEVTALVGFSSGLTKWMALSSETQE